MGSKSIIFLCIAKLPLFIGFLDGLQVGDFSVSCVDISRSTIVYKKTKLKRAISSTNTIEAKPIMEA
ncbi:hypothetical protein EM70_015120 [Vibrio parahaemolyticus]|nr:hypothetical protein FORC22_1955 [Vibrio parahaemolyticus]ETZ09146.1 hypothetical protein AJ90_07285 [Vibrio parahaemolyticus M0605]OAR54073.1 hypothetical protein EM70_015120 [Vibrio parahaemolyticus]ODY59232.1 hypothetical protein BBM96_07105 [Vibrio parahaemolyticus]ODY61938.1 hypothetical protein BBM26_02105 [Vibrio parahaemolyticus]